MTLHARIINLRHSTTDIGNKAAHNAKVDALCLEIADLIADRLASGHSAAGLVALGGRAVTCRR